MPVSQFVRFKLRPSVDTILDSHEGCQLDMQQSRTSWKPSLRTLTECRRAVNRCPKSRCSKTSFNPNLEVLLRMGFFSGVLAVMTIWEMVAPRRQPGMLILALGERSASTQSIAAMKWSAPE
jgi:hypothetical protein